MTRRLTLIMAWLFAIGSTCFAVGSVPIYFNRVGTEGAAITFFIGSVFFTSAAYLQYFVAINARRTERRFLNFSDLNSDIASSGIQLIGTISFNISTLAAMAEHLSVQQADRLVWAPDAFGSTAFLISSVIAFRAVRGPGNTRTREWRIAGVNLLGSIAFGISAMAAIVLTTGEMLNISRVNTATFVGAVLFLVGAVLTMPRENIAMDS